LQRLVQVRIADSSHRLAEMREGIFQSLNRFCLICGISHDGVRIEARGRWSTQGTSESVIRGNNMVVDLPDGTNALSGPPGVLLCGHGLRQARKSLLIEGDFREELRSGAGRRGGGSGSCLARLFIR